MSDVVIAEIDPHDEVALRAWWEVGHATGAERPHDFWPAWETARISVVLPEIDGDKALLAAYREDRMVGAARLGLPLTDNTHLMILDIMVAPPERRHGAVSALLAAVEERARSADRNTLLSMVHTPVDTENDGSRFAASRGYAVASNEEIKVADLLATQPTWPALADLAAERLGDYTLVSWTDPTPQERIEGLCELYSRFLSEIPLGEVDLRPQRWTVEKMRAAEARRAKVGREHLVVAAVAPDGSLAGYSDLTIATGSPHLASIDSTLVVAQHRGRRLGLAMKVRLHQRTREVFPRAGVIATGNAGVNSWMNAVNEQLGYRVVECCLDVQKVL